MSDKELLERVRRTETKVTRLCSALGVYNREQKPQFTVIPIPYSARLELPSPQCTLKEVLDSIPVSWDGPVTVYIGSDVLATIRRG